MWPTMFGMVHSFWWGKFNPRSPWNILEFCAGIGSLCPAGSSLASLEALVDGRKNNWLVLCFFPYTGNVIIPTDGLNDLIFFRGLETTNQIMWGKKPVEVGGSGSYVWWPEGLGKWVSRLEKLGHDRVIEVWILVRNHAYPPMRIFVVKWYF